MTPPAPGAPLRTGERPTASRLVGMLREARRRTLEIIADLDDRQLLGPVLPIAYPPPALSSDGPPPRSLGSIEVVGGDVEIPGGAFSLGSPRDLLFVFDNEKWAHPVEVQPFSISRAAVSQGEFAAFVDDGGYAR